MSDRFYLQDEPKGETITISGPEAKHLATVLRAKVGDPVVCFDGKGKEYQTAILSIRGKTIELKLLSVEEVNREEATAIHLAVSLPKGDRQRYLIEKAVEIGVTSLTPLITERSVAQPTDKAWQRLERFVIEASKQCGRTRLMPIHSPVTWPKFAESQQEVNPQQTRLFAHPYGSESHLDWKKLDFEKEFHIAIGPEGGFSEAEYQQALDAGWQAISLGPRILRVETAAVAAAVQIQTAAAIFKHPR
ncbi:Ribosomal RNA small subunit methyltransferase E [Planctomycetales bacterium 10988]|nr:Ribosomal RNA small subunit methyltransferase E [Planctomycetales bacterium 10988]